MVNSTLRLFEQRNSAVDQDPRSGPHTVPALGNRVPDRAPVAVTSSSGGAQRVPAGSLGSRRRTGPTRQDRRAGRRTRATGRSGRSHGPEWADQALGSRRHRGRVRRHLSRTPRPHQRRCGSDSTCQPHPTSHQGRSGLTWKAYCSQTSTGLRVRALAEPLAPATPTRTPRKDVCPGQ